jgi:hypothetical protein
MEDKKAEEVASIFKGKKFRYLLFITPNEQYYLTVYDDRQHIQKYRALYKMYKAKRRIGEFRGPNSRRKFDPEDFSKFLRHHGVYATVEEAVEVRS